MNNTNCEIEVKPVTDTGCNQDAPETETFVQDKTSLRICDNAAGTFGSCETKRTLSAYFAVLLSTLLVIFEKKKKY